MKTFTISEEHLRIILTALAELPAKYSYDVIKELHKQVTKESDAITVPND
jgi:hypothetical protein